MTEEVVAVAETKLTEILELGLGPHHNLLPLWHWEASLPMILLVRTAAIN